MPQPRENERSSALGLRKQQISSNNVCLLCPVYSELLVHMNLSFLQAYRVKGIFAVIIVVGVEVMSGQTKTKENIVNYIVKLSIHDLEAVFSIWFEEVT